ncbi:MAG: DUF1080 domain-containing protein [Odoribacteraceae bacterium]|jgi:HEAT repeat protein|nr:DUF1080 domain-containing protein [Odoribacteraceae bacterium]
MIRHILLTATTLVALCLSAVAQSDNRTRETKIADIIMLLPADNTAKFNTLMSDLFALGDVIDDLAPRLSDPGGDDARIRYAISGLTIFASKEPAKSAAVEKNLVRAIPAAPSDEIRDFLLIQLQYVAGDKSVETVAAYLANDRLRDAAARVLIRVNSDDANKALLDALARANGGQQIALVRALGETAYAPAAPALASLLASPDASLEKALLDALARVAAPESGKILNEKARATGYLQEPSGALDAYILYLENRLLKRDNKQVLAAAGNLLKATSTGNRIAAKTAALSLYTRSASESKAIAAVIAALKSDDKQYRVAALGFLTGIKSDKTRDALVARLKGEKNDDVKADIIRALGNHGDPVVLPVIVNILSNTASDEVKQAAIVVAGKLDGEKAIAPILAATRTGDEETVAAGKAVLQTIKSDNLVAAVAAALSPDLPSPAAVALLEILAARGAVAQFAIVREWARSPDKAARAAACKALKEVVAEEHAPLVASLLEEAPDGEQIAPLQEALRAALSTLPRDEQSKRVAAFLAASRHPARYHDVLAMIGGNEGLKTLLPALAGADADAAFEALVNWSDAAAMTPLLDIAKSDDARAGKALSGYIAKVNKSDNTPEKRVLLLRDALEIARTPALKREIIQQLAAAGTFTGLMTAGAFLDDNDPDVRQAAVQAVRAIAIANPAYHGREVASLLEKAIALNKDAEAEYQAQEILKHLASLPGGDGFARLILDGKNPRSAKDYGDFELYIDWKIAAGGNARIALGATSLLTADGDGEWHTAGITVVNGRLTVHLDGRPTISDTVPRARGRVELQPRGVEYRDAYIREIPRAEPYQLPAGEQAEGFVPMFNGIDMTGWMGNLQDYIVRDGVIACVPSDNGHGNLYTEQQYANFIMRFEFKLTPAANNGLGIRTPLDVDPAYFGMELQILDNEADVYKELAPYQYHGSVYGIIPAKRGFQKPVGEWNVQEVVADGNHIKVTLNGTVILDGDIAAASKNFTAPPDKQQHPGLSNKSGYIGFLGHGSEVEFRNLRIKELKGK